MRKYGGFIRAFVQAEYCRVHECHPHQDYGCGGVYLAILCLIPGVMMSGISSNTCRSSATGWIRRSGRRTWDLYWKV